MLEYINIFFGGFPMNADKGLSCLNCIHYTDKLGSSGYCKLYRHDITRPELICSRFEKNTSANLNKNRYYNEDVQFSKEDEHFDLNKLLKKSLYYTGIASCFILLLFAVVFGSAFEVAVINYDNVSMFPKVLIVALLAVIILSLFFLLFAIVNKYHIAQAIVLLFTIISIIVVFFKYDSVWYQINNFIAFFYEKVLRFS
jgi:hypothetical protein